MNIQTTESFKSKVYPGVTFEIRKFTEREAAQLRFDLAGLTERLVILTSDAEVIRGKYPELDKVTEANLDQDEKEKLSEAEREALEVERKAREAAVLEAMRKIDPADWGRLITINNEVDKIGRLEITPKWVRAGLLSVKGLTVDGKEAGVSEFLEHASDAAFDEVSDRIRQHAELSGDDRKNSESPSTSATPVEGETPDTTALAAATPATT